MKKIYSFLIAVSVCAISVNSAQARSTETTISEVDELCYGYSLSYKELSNCTEQFKKALDEAKLHLAGSDPKMIPVDAFSDPKMIYRDNLSDPQMIQESWSDPKMIEKSFSDPKM